MNDRSLIQRAIDGDRTAFAALYDKYAGLIRAICYDETFDLPTAQRLTQQVFATAHRRITANPEVDNFGHLLIDICRHTLANWKSTCTESPPHAAKIAEVVSIQTVHEILMELDATERECLHAYFTMGKSTEDASKVLGRPVKGYRQLLEETLEKCLRWLHCL